MIYIKKGQSGIADFLLDNKKLMIFIQRSLESKRQMNPDVSIIKIYDRYFLDYQISYTPSRKSNHHLQNFTHPL